MTLLGLLLVRIIAGSPSFLPSCQDWFLDLLLDLRLLCILWFFIPTPCLCTLILVLRGLLRPPPWSVGLGFVATCMSDRSLAQLTFAIERLILSTDRLSSQIERLVSSQPSSSSQHTGPSVSTEPEGRQLLPSLDELSRVPFPDKFELHCLTARYRDIEEGPGPTPDFCLKAASDRLSNKAPGTAARAKEAFAAGFWTHTAIQTCTAYHPRELFAGTKKQHWVVLRSTFSEPFRTCTWRDVQKICDTNHADFVCETFESITEVEIYCFGAQAPVPSLRSCSAVA